MTEVRYQEFEPEIQLKNLSEEEKEELLTAYQQELKNLTVEQMKQEVPAGLIRFVTPMDSEMLAWEEQHNDYYEYSEFSRISFYPVYRSFEQTCRLLERHGIEPGDDYSMYSIESYTINDGWLSGQYIITDPVEIQQLNQVVTAYKLQYYNSLYKTETLAMTMRMLKDGEAKEEQVIIYYQQMPEFLKQYLHGTENKQ